MKMTEELRAMRKLIKENYIKRKAAKMKREKKAKSNKRRIRQRSISKLDAQISSPYCP